MAKIPPEAPMIGMVGLMEKIATLFHAFWLLSNAQAQQRHAHVRVQEGPANCGGPWHPRTALQRSRCPWIAPYPFLFRLSGSRFPLENRDQLSFARALRML